MALNWVAVNGGNIPANAVCSGSGASGALYVARAHHEGGILPGKLIQGHKYALISYSRKEIWKYQYDVMVGTQYKWVGSSDGNIPSNAVVGGRTSGGETLYVGRVSFKGGMEPGKIQPSHRCIYFPYGSAEQSSNSYEVLCNEKPPPPRSIWVKSSATSPIPSLAHIGGKDSDGAAIYVGRANHEGDLLPAKVIPSKKSAYISYDNEEILKNDFEVLCQGRVNWVKSKDGVIPPGAIPGGRKKTGAQVYIGRGNFMESLTVGKIDPITKTLYIPFAGSEVPIKSFEVLVEL